MIRDRNHGAHPRHGKPIVIGSSFSGLLMSLALSRERIDHFVVGAGPPSDTPRLGESMNEAAAPELWRLFGRQFPECFYSKKHISLLSGRYASMIQLDTSGKKGLSRFAHAAGTSDRPGEALSFRAISHLDRIQLDRKLYQLALQHPCCDFIEARVESVDYSEDDDSIHSVEISSGQTVPATYLFDTGGPRSKIAEAASIGTRILGTKQRVVWTHFVRKTSSSAGTTCPTDSVWWRHGTNLLRLDRQTDGVEGIAWLIPLGDTISIGASFDDESCLREEVAKEKLLERIVESYAARGLAFTDVYRSRKEVCDVSHNYFVRERAFGANWLLVGGSYVQIWFPSSAGVWTTSAAAGMVREFLGEPERAGRRYEHIMAPLLSFHDHIDEMIRRAPFSTKPEVYRFWAVWMSGIFARAVDYQQIAQGKALDVRSLVKFGHWLSGFLNRAPRAMLLFLGGLSFIACETRTTDSSPRRNFSSYRNFPWMRVKSFVKGLPFAFMKLKRPGPSA